MFIVEIYPPEILTISAAVVVPVSLAVILMDDGPVGVAITKIEDNVRHRRSNVKTISLSSSFWFWFFVSIFFCAFSFKK